MNVAETLRYIYIYIYIWYTDVTVRYVPRFDTISVQQEKKKEIYYAQFLFIYFEQTVVQIKKIHLEVKVLNIITCYIYKICFVFIVSVHK